MAHLLTERRRQELDLLLVSDAYLGRTPSAWWGTGPTSSSPAAVKADLEKLAYLRRLDAHTLDLSMLPAERRRFLAGVGRRLIGQALQRREPECRYPILLTLLAQSAVDVLDETLLLFDQAITGRESAAKQKMTEALAERAKGGENRQALLDDILAIVLDPQSCWIRRSATSRSAACCARRSAWTGCGRRGLTGANRCERSRAPGDDGRFDQLPAPVRAGRARGGALPSPARQPTRSRTPTTSCTPPWSTWRPSWRRATRARSGSPPTAS